MEEVWRDIGGYEDYYQVSNLGMVKGVKNGKNRLLKPSVNNVGYLSVALCKNSKSKYFLIHRLVAIHFIPNPLEKQEVNHMDENKTNNQVNNLEWMTHMENSMFGSRNKKIF